MKRRNEKFFKEKKIIGLKLAEKENREAIRAQGYIELEIPIHDGYNANYILREDILNREDADMFQEALDLCKKEIWCKNKSFRFKNHKTKKWEVWKPILKTINKSQYDSLSAGARRFFYETRIKNKHWRNGFSDKEYHCSLSYELKIVITKSYITHRREHDSILYQIDAEIEKELNKLTDGHPWGGYGRHQTYWNRLVDKTKKLADKLDLTNIKKIYKGVNTKNDLLDR